MILTATRGKSFAEDFTFKSADGKLTAVPFGTYSVTLVRGDFIAVSPAQILRNGVRWTLTAQETQELKYSQLFFTLTFNGQEITRGILRVE